MIMNNWFECKVVSEKLIEKGTTKRVQETYMVDALTFGEAEQRIIKEVSPYCNGQLEVKDLRRARYSEWFPSDKESADRWFKVKCMFITLDEKTEKEKETASMMLVQAGNVNEAIEYLQEGMKGSMVDYRIGTVQETKILDVFPFEAKTKKEESENKKLKIVEAGNRVSRLFLNNEFNELDKF